MYKKLIVISLISSLWSVTTLASESRSISHPSGSHHQSRGIGIGAVTGVLLGGLPGLVGGLVVGGLIGHGQDLQQDLDKTHQALASAENERQRQASLVKRITAVKVASVRNLSLASSQISDTVKQLIDSFSANIYFKLGSDALESQYDPYLQKIQKILKRLPTLNIGLTGYADRIGNREENLRLSKDRANAVAEKLIAMGVDASRIKTQGLGEAQMTTSSGDSSAYAFDRRVQLRFFRNDPLGGQVAFNTESIDE